MFLLQYQIKNAYIIYTKIKSIDTGFHLRAYFGGCHISIEFRHIHYSVSPGLLLNGPLLLSSLLCSTTSSVSYCLCSLYVASASFFLPLFSATLIHSLPSYCFRCSSFANSFAINDKISNSLPLWHWWQYLSALLLLAFPPPLTSMEKGCTLLSVLSTFPSLWVVFRPSSFDFVPCCSRLVYKSCWENTLRIIGLEYTL